MNQIPNHFVFESIVPKKTFFIFIFFFFFWGGASLMLLLLLQERLSTWKECSGRLESLHIGFQDVAAWIDFAFAQQNQNKVKFPNIKS